MTAPGSDGLDCQDVVELVTDYLEDALEPDLRDRMEEHLADCDGCAAYLDQMRRTAAALGSLPAPSVSEAMNDRLLAAFRDRTSGRLS